MNSSSTVKIGLEESFKLLTSKYEELKIQKLILERKVEEIPSLEESIKKAQERIFALENAHNTLEYKNELLQEHVRTVEASKEDLLSKLQLSEQDRVQMNIAASVLENKHPEDTDNLRFSLQTSLNPPSSPFNFSTKGIDNLSPVGVSDVYSSPILFLEDRSPTPLVSRSVSMDPTEKSNEIKSLTNRLTSVISHRNELLNTIESCNNHIQELQDSLKERENREAELLNKLAEKEMLMGLLAEQLERVGGETRSLSDPISNNSVKSIRSRKSATNEQYLDNFFSINDFDQEDSVQLVKSDIDDYSQEDSRRDRSPKSHSPSLDTSKSIDLTPIRTQNKRSCVISSSNSAQVLLEEVLAVDDINSMRPEIESMLRQLIILRQSNAKLLVKMQTLQGNIQVCCRTRPPNDSEISAKGKICIEVPDDTEVTCFDAKCDRWKTFVFDRVWNSTARQVDVFADIEPMISTVVDGYNACIIAYGQTGSGKTFTMDGYGDDYGVSYRTMQKFFELLNDRKYEFESNNTSMHQSTCKVAALASPERKNNKDDVDSLSDPSGEFSDDGGKDRGYFSYSVEISIIEIYNEQVFDLLVDVPGGCQRNGTSLDIRQEPDGNIIIPGLQKLKVQSLDDVMLVFGKGTANRATGSTNLNEHSSRSHLIVSIDVEVNNGDLACTKGKLVLVDLAGSERVKLSGVTGNAMKEAQHINKSLSALGDVMEALDTKAKFIPYRNSKLTFILQNCLGGNARTMMIVTICPTDITIEETLFALQLATRVRKITTNSQLQRNTNLKNLDAEMRKLKIELRDAHKKTTMLGSALLEAKKNAKKAQEKEKAVVTTAQVVPVSMAQQQHQVQMLEIKFKIAEEARKSAEQSTHQQKRNVTELTNKLAEAKESRDRAAIELEVTQKSLRRTVEMARKITAEYSKLVKVHHSKSREEENVNESEDYAKESSLINMATLIDNELDILQSTTPPDSATRKSYTSNGQSSESKFGSDRYYDLDSRSPVKERTRFHQQFASASMVVPLGKTSASSDRNSEGRWTSQGYSASSGETTRRSSAPYGRSVSTTRVQRSTTPSSFGSPVASANSRPSSRSTVRSSSRGSVRSASTGGVPNSPPLQSRVGRFDRSRSGSMGYGESGLRSASASSTRQLQRRDSKLSESEFEDGVSLLSGSNQSMGQYSLNSLNARVMSITERTQLALKKHQMRMERLRGGSSESGKEG